jgi:3-hydroxybutyryl-CoA dehydrogenase
LQPGFELRRAAVVGGGAMGVGIAHALASSGIETYVADADDARAETARSRVAAVFGDAVQRGKLGAADAAAATARVHAAASVAALPAELDLIVEAVPEVLALKRAVLAACALRKPALLATNTSGLSIDALAADLPAPKRFIGLHFFNPVWAMSLVEVVTGAATAPTTIAQALTVCRQLGKETIVVENSPGFASSRLGICLGLEAMRMVEEGIASPADIDRAMELGYKHPMGPLRLTDLVGLDVRLDIAHTLEAALGPRFAPPQILVDRVAAGELGKKTGRGFYDWSSGNAQPRGAQP